MPRRIVIPPGLLNPEGTTIVEIPSELDNEESLTAIFKEPNGCLADVCQAEQVCKVIPKRTKNTKVSILEKPKFQKKSRRNRRESNQYRENGSFGEYQLQETQFDETQFNEGRLEESQLEESHLEKSHLEESLLEQSQLGETPLEETKVEGTLFEETQFQKNLFRKTEFEENQFEETQFEETQFEENQFEETQFEENLFEGTQFVGNQFEASQFEETQLEESQFKQQLQNLQGSENCQDLKCRTTSKYLQHYKKPSRQPLNYQLQFEETQNYQQSLDSPHTQTSRAAFQISQNQYSESPLLENPHQLCQYPQQPYQPVQQLCRYPQKPCQDPQQPCHYPQQSFETPQQPCYYLQNTSQILQNPSQDPQQPFENSQQPSLNPQQPSLNPQQPFENPQHPLKTHQLPTKESRSIELTMSQLNETPSVSRIVRRTTRTIINPAPTSPNQQIAAGNQPRSPVNLPAHAPLRGNQSRGGITQSTPPYTHGTNVTNQGVCPGASRAEAHGTTQRGGVARTTIEGRRYAAEPGPTLVRQTRQETVIEEEDLIMDERDQQGLPEVFDYMDPTMDNSRGRSRGTRGGDITKEGLSEVLGYMEPIFDNSRPRSRGAGGGNISQKGLPEVMGYMNPNLGNSRVRSRGAGGGHISQQGLPEVLSYMDPTFDNSRPRSRGAGGKNISQQCLPDVLGYKDASRVSGYDSFAAGVGSSRAHSHGGGKSGDSRSPMGRSPRGRSPSGRSPGGRSPERRSPERRSPGGRSPGGRGTGGRSGGGGATAWPTSTNIGSTNSATYFETTTETTTSGPGFYDSTIATQSSFAELGPENESNENGVTDEDCPCPDDGGTTGNTSLGIPCPVEELSMELDQQLAAIEQEERELIENDLRNVQMARRQLALHATRLSRPPEELSFIRSGQRDNCGC